MTLLQTLRPPQTGLCQEERLLEGRVPVPVLRRQVLRARTESGSRRTTLSRGTVAVDERRHVLPTVQRQEGEPPRWTPPSGRGEAAKAALRNGHFVRHIVRTWPTDCAMLCGKMRSNVHWMTRTKTDVPSAPGAPVCSLCSDTTTASRCGRRHVEW